MGSSYGANLVACAAMTQKLNYKALLLLSATRMAYRFPDAFPKRDYPLKSGLYIASRGEPEPYQVVPIAERLLEDTVGSKMLVLYDQPAHALGIYQRIEKSRTEIAKSLKSNL